MSNHVQEDYFGKDLEAMSFALNYHKWILDEFKAFIKGDVAEIGAGIGDVSKMLLNFDITSLSSFEPSKNMFIQLSKEVRGLNKVNAYNLFFDDKIDDNTFDTVIYINVLEHIEKDLQEIKNVYRTLRKGGHVLVFVPALPFLYSDFDAKIGHFKRYMKNDLMTIAHNVGLEIVKLNYFDLAGIIPWYLNFVVFKNGMNARSVNSYDKLIVPIMRRVEQVITAPIGKNLLLVARKN